MRAIVIRGSAGIYGAEPAAPQFFTEEMARLYPLRTRFQRDIGEIENYFEAYSRRHPEVGVHDAALPAVARPGHRQPGHALPVAAARARPTSASTRGCSSCTSATGWRRCWPAIRNPVRGAVNVAAPGTIGLTKMLRMAGKVSVPVPAAAVRDRRQRRAPARHAAASRPTSGGCCATAARSTSRGWSRRSATRRASTRSRRSRTTCATQGGRRLIPSLRDVAVGA